MRLCPDIMNREVENLKRLLDISIYFETDLKSMSHKIETNHCTYSSFQKVFTAEFINDVVISSEQFYFYEFCDTFGLNIIYFMLGEYHFFIGPFAQPNWDYEIDFHIYNYEESISSENLLSYRRKYPTHSTGQMIRYISSFIDAVTQTIYSVNYSYKRSTFPQQKYEGDIMNASIIKNTYTRYETEDKFMYAISEGNDLVAFRMLNKLSTLSTSNKNLLTEKTAFASLRTLVRIGAKRSSISPIIINKILIKYANKYNKMSYNLTREKIAELNRELIREMCHFIKQHRLKCYTPIIADTISYIEVYMHEDIKINDIAIQFDVSQGYLAKLFKQETGVTFVQYITDCRLTKAAYLLKLTTMRIQEVSFEVGYLDNNYFIKLFKTKYGCTPSTYRKESTDKIDFSGSSED